MVGVVGFPSRSVRVQVGYHKVAGYEVQVYRVGVVLGIPAVPDGLPCETPHAAAHGQVGSVNQRSRYQVRVRVADQGILAGVGLVVRAEFLDRLSHHSMRRGRLTGSHHPSHHQLGVWVQARAGPQVAFLAGRYRPAGRGTAGAWGFQAGRSSSRRVSAPSLLSGQWRGAPPPGAHHHAAAGINGIGV